jgi:hypothetical protein
VLVAGIYAFVWLVYRGLIAEARTEGQEEKARQARADVPRMTGAAPRSAEAAPGRAETPPPVVAPWRAPAAPPEVSGAAAARTVVAEETPGERAAPPQVPALLARDLPREIARAEVAPAEPAGAESEAEVSRAGGQAGKPALPEEPEPGTLVGGATTPRVVVLRSECVELPPGREFPLLAAATIGRAEHNLVVLPDTFVSSQHALIFLKEGRRVLRDRGSTNGTLINGHRVNGDHILRDGDQITVGTSVLRYVEPE